MDWNGQEQPTQERVAVFRAAILADVHREHLEEKRGAMVTFLITEHRFNRERAEEAAGLYIDNQVFLFHQAALTHQRNS